MSDKSKVQAAIADKINASFDARKIVADEYNARLERGEIKPSLRQVVWWSMRGGRETREKEWREKSGRKKPSLHWAMNDAVTYWFWSGFFMKLIADIATVLSPLLVKAIITFATESYR